MKILIDLTSLADNLSGIERFAICIARELIEYRDKKYILVFKNSIHPSFLRFNEDENVKIIVLKGKNKLLFNQVILPWNLYKFSADIYLFLAFPAPWLLFKRNVISTVHDIVCWDCPNTMKFLSEVYFKLSTITATRFGSRVITISKFSKRRIEDKLRVNPEKMWLIYAGISEAFIDAEYNENIIEKYNLPSRYILSLSTIEPRKNLGLLLKAYEFLRKNNEVDIDLVLAGRKGWKVDKIINDLDKDVVKHIHFTGYIEDDDLPSIYHFANLFVYPSMYEGFGIPPLEAMACGTPVITSDAASLPEVCGEAAVYFVNNDLKSLEETIRLFFNSSDASRKHYVEAGFRQSEVFSWKNEAKKLNDYLMTLK